MSNAIAGVGASFKRETASSGVYAAIAEITQISGPDLTRGTIDVTNLDSVGGYREFIGSFRDGGTVTLSMNFALTTYNQMKTDFEAADAHNYEIVLPDAGETTLLFAAFVTKLGMMIPTDDKISADVELKITGQVELST
jgi:predicted secreted protein